MINDVKPFVAVFVGDSSPAVVKSEILKSQRTGGEGTSTHPHKDLEIVNSEAGVAKKVTVNKEEQKQPAKIAESIPTDKEHLIVSDMDYALLIIGRWASVLCFYLFRTNTFIDSGLQETPKSSTLSMESNKNVLKLATKWCFQVLLMRLLPNVIMITEVLL
ncbi:hypothetical protein Tco_0066308 [Tanacetum coccineum]